jgi:hypothetical protein
MDFLLSTAYLGPIQYFSKLLTPGTIIIERYEHFPKQSYRNRCIIYGANGPLTLTVPVTKENIKEYTRDIRIDYATNWLKIHLKAIESAYNNSPFYPYYIDDIRDILNKKETYLYDLNQKLTLTLCDLIKIKPIVSETNDYIVELPPQTFDFRECIHPKLRMFKPDENFEAPQYSQVFASKHGFIENLSIIDMLFNIGPDCKELLKNSLKNS